MYLHSFKRAGSLLSALFLRKFLNCIEKRWDV